MALTITAIDAPLGTEVSGVDLSRPLDPDQVAALTAAWLDRIVLVFHGQDLDQPAQRRFAGYFGTVGERARPADARPEGADYDGAFMLVSNVRNENGEPIGSLPDGEMWFHHDMSYTPAPHKATVLHAIDIPSVGGNTRFADMYRAYDALPERLKRSLAGRRALQVYDYATIGRVDVERGLDGIRHEWQPIFVRHPETGRTALYVSRLMTARIEGMDRAEGDAVLEALFAAAEDPSVVYEHVWAPGDVLMWDNRCSIHARTDFPASERRLLRRCTVEGGPMLAAEAAA